MSDVIAMTITGILVGCLYGLIALGLVLIFKATQVFNLAQGEMFLMGTWVIWSFVVSYSQRLTSSYFSFLARQYKWL